MGASSLLLAALVSCAPAPTTDSAKLGKSRSAFVGLETELMAPSVPFDLLGAATAVFGTTLASGAPQTTTSALRSGRVYVWARSGSSWSAATPIEPSVAVADQLFGDSVDIDGDTMVVGGRPSDAYVFVRSGSTWTEQQRLTNSASLPMRSAALSGATIVVGRGAAGQGNPGEAYVFARSGTTWTEQQKLMASDASPLDRFGERVDVDGDTIVVGAPANDAAASDAGAVFVYTRSGTVWSEQDKITAETPIIEGGFGLAVAVEGDTLLVGASRFDMVGAALDQKVTVYTRSGTTWTKEADLVPSVAPTDSSTWGRFFSLSGNIAAASSHDAVYVFSRSGTTWTERTRLVSGLPGGTVDVDGMVVGVGYGGSNGGAGRQFVYELVPKFQLGEACSASTDCASGNCADAVCCDTVCGAICQACTAAKTGGTDGTCAPVTADTDPDDDCADDGSPACTGNGLCDGSGACGTYASSSGCAPSTCDSDSDCTSAHCAITPGDSEGICCDSACDAPCSTCRAAEQSPGGTDGVCGAAADGTDPGDQCTDTGADSCFADGLCDGAGACREFAPAGTGCGASTCDNALATGLACDGAGACEPGNTQCEPFACDGDVCGTTCADDEDCSTGFTCDSGDCVQPQARCSSDNTRLIAADGSETPCSPYFCDQGACLDRCETSSDCAEAFVCDTTESPPACVTAPSGGGDGSSDDAGCGCRTTSSRPTPPVFVLAAIGLLLLGRQRRRR